MLSLLLSYFVGIAHAESGTAPLFPTINLQDPDTSVATVANRILDLMFAIAVPLAVVAIIYSAYVLITSAGKPDGITQLKKNIVYILIGFALIIFAVGIVQFIRNLFLG